MYMIIWADFVADLCLTSLGFISLLDLYPQIWFILA